MIRGHTASTDNRRGRPTAGLSAVGVLLVLAILVAAAAAGLATAAWLTGKGLPVLAQGRQQEEDDEESRQYSYITFGPTVVNLAEGRLTRYLKVSIALQVPEESAKKVRTILTEERQAVFSNWLITHLSDLELDQVKGSAAVNRLREEIRTGFNRLLSRYSEASIENVLFKEFSIQ